MSESVCVFVVDDEALVLLTIEHAMEDGGFDHKTVLSAEDALTLLEKEGETCRALVTDVNLGGKLTGWDVARSAREQLPTLPVVYVTGDSAHEWAAHGVPNSVLISKPFVAAQIVNAVAGLLNTEPSLSAAS
ncbi:response regulator [Brevundimonas goettingensis]|uniref:Response regulator n=1 Tax=Brevundimonas goettingensis TaxID=2774190 RepID=A0A975GV06_9CAUL|nr:response regulator [Brevundimonas goettingensis]QTC90866.1 response regulator [Brevundimonas goettingensis]